MTKAFFLKQLEREVDTPDYGKTCWRYYQFSVVYPLISTSKFFIYCTCTLFSTESIMILVTKVNTVFLVGAFLKKSARLLQ